MKMHACLYMYFVQLSQHINHSFSHSKRHFVSIIMRLQKWYIYIHVHVHILTIHVLHVHVVSTCMYTYMYVCISMYCVDVFPGLSQEPSTLARTLSSKLWRLKIPPATPKL